MLGEPGAAQPFCTPVEVGHREALLSQLRVSAGDQLQGGVTKAPLAKPPQHRLALSQQREVPDIVTAFAQGD